MFRPTMFWLASFFNRKLCESGSPGNREIHENGVAWIRTMTLNTQPFRSFHWKMPCLTVHPNMKMFHCQGFHSPRMTDVFDKNTLGDNIQRNDKIYK
uniref:Uncharacterized protein n=1 Tax=Vespula pensylvanica TaxID=30213 RepID=A0A834P1J0_VESPE|nr:hypothetical protein H0235_007553 [Vespula pensylvanica]